PHRLDVARGVRIVVERFADAAHRDLEHGLRDVRALPQLRDELVAADDRARPRGEVAEDGERPWLERDRFVAFREPSGGDVQPIGTEPDSTARVLHAPAAPAWPAG